MSFKLPYLLLPLLNFVSMPVVAYNDPVIIVTNDNFDLKHSSREIENIARQYAKDQDLFPETQNRKFIATYAPLGEEWLVFVSEPEGEADASESLNYFYLYIDDSDGHIFGVYSGILGRYHDEPDRLK